MRLCDFPQGIFVMALSTAALPSLSALAASGAKDGAREDVGARDGARDVRRHPGERRARRAGRADRRGALPARARSTPPRRTRRRARCSGRGEPSGRSPRCGRRCPRSTRSATRGRRSSSARSICARSSRSRSGCGGRWGTWASAWRSRDRARCRWCCCSWACAGGWARLKDAMLARSTARTLAASLLAGGGRVGRRPRCCAGEGGTGACCGWCRGWRAWRRSRGVVLAAAWGLRAPELEELGRLFRRRLSR